MRGSTVGVDGPEQTGRDRLVARQRPRSAPPRPPATAPARASLGAGLGVEVQHPRLAADVADALEQVGCPRRAARGGGAARRPCRGPRSRATPVPGASASPRVRAAASTSLERGDPFVGLPAALVTDRVELGRVARRRTRPDAAPRGRRRSGRARRRRARRRTRAPRMRRVGEAGAARTRALETTKARTPVGADALDEAAPRAATSGSSPSVSQPRAG